MDQLKIGINSSSLTILPSPVGIEGIKRSINTIIDTYRDMNNNLNVYITGNKKIEFNLKFQNKTKANFEQIEAYCNTPMYYYVSIDNGTRTIISGYYNLIINNIEQTAITSDFLYNFNVDFYER